MDGLKVWICSHFIFYFSAYVNNTDETTPMKPEELSQLSDEELLTFAEQNKPSPLLDAFLIGFLIGIILYGVFSNAWGFLFLLPLFLIYALLKKPKTYKALTKELEKRNLKPN